MQLRPLTAMTESQWTFVRNEHNKITSLPNGFVFRGDLLLFHIFGIIDLLYAKDVIQLMNVYFGCRRRWCIRVLLELWNDIFLFGWQTGAKLYMTNICVAELKNS